MDTVIPGRNTERLLDEFPEAILSSVSTLIVEGPVSNLTADLLTVWLTPYLRKVILARQPFKQLEFDGVANPFHHTNVCCTNKDTYTQKQLLGAVRKCLCTFIPYWNMDGQGGTMRLLDFRKMPIPGRKVPLVRMNGESLGKFVVTDVGDTFDVDGILYGELHVDGFADNPPIMFKVTK